MSGVRGLAGIAAALTAALALAAQAGEVTRAGALEITGPWARASIGTTRPTAAYLTIRNTGDRPDQLVGVATPAAGHTETHAMVDEGGVSKMRPAGPLAIPPGGELRLEPGGLHIMLMQLHEALEEGESIPLTLTFERAGEVTVNLPVAAAGARGAPE